MEETVEGARGGSHIVVVVVAVVSLTMLYLALSARRKSSTTGPRKQLPPGPRGWPVVGSLLSLGEDPHHALSVMAKQYGPLMSVRFGSVKTVVASNPHMAKEMLKTFDHIMSSRPDQNISNYMIYDRKDIAFAEYTPEWRNLRKVCTQELLTASRLYQFQDSREREVMEMLRSILEEVQQGNELNMSQMLSDLGTNIITQMMWNKSHLKGNECSLSVEEAAFQKVHRDMLELAGVPNIADFVPILKPLIMYGQGLDKRMKSVHQRMDQFLDNIIDQHRKKESFVTGGKEKLDQDFVDVLLKKVDSDEQVSIENVKAIFTDMLMAGTDPTSIALKWVLTELVKNPSMMKRAQDELNSVVGPDRLVTEADVRNLEFLQAVVKETFRIHPPLPIYPRLSKSECEIEGYHIPAKTLAFINVWAIQRDPGVWEKPLEFDPDRFLGSTMDVKGHDYELLPFGSGRRVCPGLGLVLALLQYSIAQLVHAFTWSLPGDQTVEDMDRMESFTSFGPKAFPLTLMAKPRLPIHVICPT